MFLGDWLAPIGVDAGAQSSVDLVNNCFISECLGTMEKIALMLGEKEEAEKFAMRRKNLNELMHQSFIIRVKVSILQVHSWICVIQCL